MKKIILILTIGFLYSNFAFSQAERQLNFGLIGLSYDIPVSNTIAISPFAGTGFDLDWLTLGVKANYYFDELIGLSDTWDVYGGANGGFGIGIGSNNDSDFDIGLQVGGRWFWDKKWGIYFEFGGGKLGPTGGLGFTMRL